MSFQYENVWFVFYSDGKDFRYQTSADFGRTWNRADEAVAPAPNGSSSFDVLQVGETNYVGHAHYPLARYDVNAPYAKDPDTWIRHIARQIGNRRSPTQGQNFSPEERTLRAVFTINRLRQLGHPVGCNDRSSRRRAMIS